MQASPQVDVDEAPYDSNAPGTDLLHVTELEDAHDSIELLNFDNNPGFFCTETLSISDSDETSGQCKKTCLDDTHSAQLIAGIITCQFEVDILRCENQNRAFRDTARIAGNGRICGFARPLNVRRISSVFSSFPDVPNASSVGSLNHATLQICVRRSVV